MRSSGKTKSISGETVEVLRDDISAKSPVPFGLHPDDRLIAPDPRAMPLYRSAVLVQSSRRINGEKN